MTFQFFGGSVHGQTLYVLRANPRVQFINQGRQDTYRRIEYRYWNGSVEQIYVCEDRRTIR